MYKEHICRILVKAWRECYIKLLIIKHEARGRDVVNKAQGETECFTASRQHAECFILCIASKSWGYALTVLKNLYMNGAYS